MIVVGHMSGTSLDGLDICLIQFNQNGTEFKLLDALTLEYSDEILKLIQDAYGSSLDQIHAFDEAYSLLVGASTEKSNYLKRMVTGFGIGTWTHRLSQSENGNNASDR